MTKAIDVQVGGGHYKAMKIQPIEFCHANNIPFVEGNIIKYVCRWRSKNGIEDLKKARHMLDLLIELEQGSQDRTCTQAPTRSCTSCGNLQWRGCAQSAARACTGYSAWVPRNA